MVTVASRLALLGERRLRIESRGERDAFADILRATIHLVHFVWRQTSSLLPEM
jgi:hypothetical protein